MQKALLFKCLLLVGLALALLVPLGMIESTIHERNSYRSEAIRAIADSAAGNQGITGPLLVIPVDEEYDSEAIDPATHKATTVRTSRKRVVTLTPKRLALDGNLRVEKRSYGIFSAAVFELQGALTGSFDPPSDADVADRGRNSRLTWGQPKLVVGIDDTHGIAIDPKITVNDEELAPRKGTPHTRFKGGFHAQLKTNGERLTQRLPFRVDLRLAGSNAFAFTPLGDMTTANLKANWPHPSFSGFLPRERTIDDKGFQATWSVSSLAANVRQDAINASNTETASPGEPTAFRVRLIEPIDIYRLALRAVKYGILFVVLAFAAFFVFEALSATRMHPVQYGLIGLALAVFFLLLISLSEHVAFHWAYLAAGLASTLLITLYLAAALGGWRQGIGFGMAIGALYAALFGVLQSEQNALLLGSLMIFAMLATLMLATRRLDWYRVGSAA